MRALLLICGLALVACQSQSTQSPPPLDRFYWPTGLAHADAPGFPDGVLFVSNANFDKRFESGSVMAVDLSRLMDAGLPAFGTPVTSPAQVRGWSVAPEAVAQVASFTGELAMLPLGGGRFRLFIPSRSEGMKLHAVDATLSASGEVTLACKTASGRDARECFSAAPSLSPPEFEQSESGVPRATAPFGVAVRTRACVADVDCGATGACTAGACVAGGEPLADVFITHLTQADSPNLSNANLRSYLVRLQSDTVSVTADSFINLGEGATHTVAAGRKWVYVSGRFANNAYHLVRVLEGPNAVFGARAELSYRALDSRGLALSSDERHLYVAGRAPDALVVLSVVGGEAGAPELRLERGVPLPDGPTTITTIPRAGRGDLVLITCTTAGVLVIYDEDTGTVVGQVAGLGLQPFAVAVDARGPGARLFVSNFADGRVAVVDIPDLLAPHNARVVAHVGLLHRCLNVTTPDADCPRGAAP